MAPFESLGTVSYSHSMAVSLAILERERMKSGYEIVQDH